MRKSFLSFSPIFKVERLRIMINIETNVSLIEKESYKIKYDESFEEVCRNLKMISSSLYDLLPDITLSPDERLERLARVIPTSVLISRNHQTARTKLNALRMRLKELVPNEDLSDSQRIELLVKKLDELVPENLSPYKKLEKLGDFRGSDMGR